MDRGARLVGVLTHGDVLKGLAEQGATLLVQQAMRSKLETASPADALDGALMRIHQNGCRVLMVVDNEKVVGLLTAGNVGELISMEAAGRQASIAKRTKGRWERWQLKPPTFGLYTAI
jgi:predicted transcriptional regulator